MKTFLELKQLSVFEPSPAIVSVMIINLGTGTIVPMTEALMSAAVGVNEQGTSMTSFNVVFFLPSKK